MKCIVTGGCGFIGSNLAKELELQGWDVTIVDRCTETAEANLSDFCGNIVCQDVCEPLSLDGRFDAIFHMAAITDPRFEDDQRLMRENLNGFANILSLARRHDAKLIYASTASLYGNGRAPQTEDQPKELLSAYATSKLIIDEMASHHFRNRHVVGLRFFNVFGPGEAHKGRASSMIYHLARQMMAGRRPKLFADGSQRRDHIYVKDCTQACVLALGAASGIYNVGSGRATTFNELVDYINAALGTSFAPDYIPNSYGNSYQQWTQADTRRAERHLRFRAQHAPRDAVREYVSQLRSKSPMVHA